MKRRIYQFNFRGGLQTTKTATGLDHHFHNVFQNVRVRGDTAKRRKGYVRVAAATQANTAMDLDSAASEYVEVQKTSLHTLKKYWTAQLLYQPDSVTGTRVLVGWGHASDYPLKLWQDGTTLKADVIDSADATVTLTSSTTLQVDTTYAVQVKRSGTAIALRLDNVEEDTDTVADLDGKAPGGNLYFGRDNTGNYYDGTIDHFTLFDRARTDHADGWKRFADPRAEYVIADYHGEQNADSIVLDRSRYENHGEPKNTPTFGTTALCVPYEPVQAIFPFRDRNNDKRVATMIGGSMYDVEVRT